MQHLVDLLILGKTVRIGCPDARFETWIRALYRSMELSRPAGRSRVDLEYRVERSVDRTGFHVRDDCRTDVFAETAGESLARLEDALTIELQLMRPDLLFVHAAALAGQHGGFALVGNSGAGKSTLAWALTRYGLRYLSDELAPFEVGTQRAAPFSRAIHLKTEPPGPHALPPTTIDTRFSLCVPVESLAGGAADAPQEMRTLFFLSPADRPAIPEIRDLTPGEAVSRLFVHTLNAGAHPAYGVEAVMRIAGHASCYDLAAADLDATCELVRSVVEPAARGDGLSQQ